MRILLSLIFVLHTIAAGARLQGVMRLDSLKLALPIAHANAAQLDILYALSSENNTINPSEGIRYGQQMLDLANSLQDKRNIIRAYSAIGINYQFKSDYANAITYYNKAMLLCTEAKLVDLYVDLISHLAIIYQELGNNDKAIEYHLKSLKQNEKEGKKTSMAGDYGNIGIAYMQKKDYEKALEYDLKSLELFTELNDEDGVAHNYGNIGNVYKEYGNYVLALEYDLKSLELFRKLGDNGGIAINLGNIGDVYLTNVIEMDKRGALTENNEQRSSKVLLRGSRDQFLTKSISYFEQCIELSRQIEQLDNIIEFSKGLSEAYRLFGNYPKALHYYQLHVLYKDSLYSESNRLKYAQLETEREQMLKDKQIQINELAEDNKRKERIMYALTLFTLVIVTSVVTRKFYMQKRRNRHLAQERKKHLERIENQKAVMNDIAYAHSHDVSGQVATILGLADVFNTQNYADSDNKIVIDGISETAKKLDIIVKDMIIKENMTNSTKKS